MQVDVMINCSTFNRSLCSLMVKNHSANSLHWRKGSDKISNWSLWCLGILHAMLPFVWNISVLYIEVYETVAVCWICNRLLSGKQKWLIIFCKVSEVIECTDSIKSILAIELILYIHRYSPFNVYNWNYFKLKNCVLSYMKGSVFSNLTAKCTHNI